jgi:hypothetical protein
MNARFSLGNSMPAIRAKVVLLNSYLCKVLAQMLYPLTLTLLVLFVFTNHTHNALAADNFAFLTNFLY